MIPIGVSVAIVECGTILLTMREDFEVWCLPGGEIDEGESIADAARREVREETGLEVELTRLVGTYSRIGWRPNHLFLFAAHVIGGTLTPDPREVLEAHFFPFNALPQPLLFGNAYKIADAVGGVIGCVKTERVLIPDAPQISRAELYAQRDQSGVSRREFYLRSIPPLNALTVATEVAGVRVDP